MKIIIKENYDEMSKVAADIITNVINEMSENNQGAVLGLATGSTPIGTYKELINEYKNGNIDFIDVVTYNLDEYVGLDGTSDQSYRYFMDNNLFNHINIEEIMTNVPNGVTSDIEKECERYDKLIEALGYADVQVLGLGHNGHIGFNEPDKSFIAPTHKVKLSKSTIEANKRFFNSIEEVPTSAITMGMKSIMGAKKILLLVSGKEKKEILYKSLYGPITPEVPASILQLHKDLVVVCDKEAGDMIN